MLHSIFWSFAF